MVTEKEALRRFAQFCKKLKGRLMKRMEQEVVWVYTCYFSKPIKLYVNVRDEGGRLTLKLRGHREGVLDEIELKDLSHVLYEQFDGTIGADVWSVDKEINIYNIESLKARKIEFMPQATFSDEVDDVQLTVVTE